MPEVARNGRCLEMVRQRVCLNQSNPLVLTNAIEIIDGIVLNIHNQRMQCKEAQKILWQLYRSEGDAKYCIYNCEVHTRPSLIYTQDKSQQQYSRRCTGSYVATAGETI